MIVGKYTYGNGNIVVYGKDSGHNVKIGAFCSIGVNITIYVGDNHRKDWVTTFPFGYDHADVFTNFNGVGHPASKGDVIIGNDVWIAANVTIMSGVTIGDGAIIANNSHVVKDVEPYSIVGGNPARFISYRFTPEQIEKLKAIKWWEWDDAKINENTPLLCNTNIDDFINMHYNNTEI